MIADHVWHYLGDPKQYIEPFFGSGAVLLKRPPTKHEKIYEIVNDKDGFIANVWRSIQFSPDETARWCDWPINHADLQARRKALLANESRLLENLVNDPEWHDPKMAGYWIWAASCWIGTGLTRPNTIPSLTGNRGIHSQIPHLISDKGIHTDDVYSWLDILSQRLRHVKVVCGEWTRVCGGNWQDANKPVGIFMDPPYSVSDRDQQIYYYDSVTVAKDVEKWCLERGKNPNYRIVVAGYDSEYLTLLDNGWTFEAWTTNGGYGNCGEGKGKANKYRERLFISPYCVKKEELPLFEYARKIP